VFDLLVDRGRLVFADDDPQTKSQTPRQVEPLVWLVERLGKQGPAAHARPTAQPEAVHAISQRLFRAYQIDGGQMHLAGCQLIDRPFLRLSYLNKSSRNGAVRHVFVAPDGSSVEEDLVTKLGLNTISPVDGLAPRIAPHDLRALVGSGERMAAQLTGRRNPAASAGEPIAVTVIWAKRAEGRIQFSIGGQSAMLPFAGWANTLAPPPFVCQHSGAETFHLAAVDDGRLVAAEQIATCERSGRHALRNELVECQATGQHVLAEYTATCPVLGLPALEDHFAECNRCRQRVSSPALVRDTCAACRGVKRVELDDPRLVWLTGEYPVLGKFKRIRLAETETCYIVRCSTLLRQFLLVCNRETLAVERLATRRRGPFQWTDIPMDQWRAELG
jgi:hypothetical protein